MLATSVGGSPTTTYAENIGVMAATRVYSTAAYYVAAAVAILFGLSPKFGALVASIPGGVLGGITVVLYGMIGLLGAKIWKENGVDFGNPINLVPIAAGIIIGIGNVKVDITEDFSLEGISLGTIVAIAGYHLARAIAPAELRDQSRGHGHRRGRPRLRRQRRRRRPLPGGLPRRPGRTATPTATSAPDPHGVARRPAPQTAPPGGRDLPGGAVPFPRPFEQAGSPR